MRSMSEARASICSAVSSWIPSGAEAPEWHGAQRWAITLWTWAMETAPGCAGADDSGRSQTAIATVAIVATTGIHQTRRPACQELKKTRMRAVRTAMRTSTSQASSAPKVNAAWPASIVKRTGSVR